jgi:hypothetical protein
MALRWLEAHTSIGPRIRFISNNIGIAVSIVTWRMDQKLSAVGREMGSILFYFSKLMQRRIVLHMIYEKFWNI